MASKGILSGALDPKKHRRQHFVAFLSVVLLSGCFGPYGKLKTESGEKMTIRELQENWEDYSIYYADWRTVGDPGGLLFDPKSDNKTLTSDRWMKVEDQRTLSQLINSIQAKSYSPRLYQILGPDNRFYGYMYLGPTNVRVFTKTIDSNSLWVSDLQPRKLGVR